MATRLQCPSCNAPLLAPPEMAGQVVACPKCGNQVTIPGGQPTGMDPMMGAPMQQVPGQAMPGQMPGEAPAPFANFQTPAFGQPAAAPRRSGNNKQLMILLISGGVVALLVVAFLFVWAVLPAGGADSDEFAYLPDNCVMVAKVRVDAIAQSDLWNQLKTHLLGPIQSNEVDPESIETVVFGAPRPAGEGAPPEFTVFVRARPGKTIAIPPAETKGTQQETIGGHTVYIKQQGKQTSATCSLDNRTILVGTASTVRAVLQRGGAASIPSDLRAVMDQTDFSQHLSLAMVTTGLDSAIPKQDGGMAMPFDIQGILKKIQGVILQGTLGSDLRLAAEVLCTDEQAAAQIKAMVDLLLGFVRGAAAKSPQAAQLLQSLSLEVSGKKLVASVTIPNDLILQGIRSQTKKLAPGGGFPSPPGGL